MINRISSHTANWLVNQGIISTDDQSLFTYAMYCLFLGLSPVFIILSLGTVSGMLHEGILLIIPFMAIRKFSGGYHLKSAKWCFILSVITLSLALFCINKITEGQYYVFLTYAVLFSVLILYCFSPIDSDARKLSKKEKHVFQLIARIISTVIFLLYLLFLFYGLNSICSALGMGIIMSALLQIPCIIERCSSNKKCHHKVDK